VSSFILLYLILFNKVTGKGIIMYQNVIFYKTLQYMKQIKMAKKMKQNKIDFKEIASKRLTVLHS